MNNDTPTPQNSYNTPNTNNSKKKLIIILVAAALVIAAVTSYIVVAKAQNLWPFAASQQATKSQPSLAIEQVEVTGTKEQEVLGIKVKLTSEDTGHCVLTVSSKVSSLIIDESKREKNTDENAVPVKNCTGWSIGSSGLPNGTYKVDVKFVGSKSKLSTSQELTLDR